MFGSHLADVLIMFARGMEPIINLGELLFKVMLVNCQHDKAAPKAFQAAPQPTAPAARSRSA